MITAVFFDLDGTLLPMDQESFLKAYMGSLAQKMQPYGYDPKALIAAIWKGTGAMVANDGKERNDEVFWKVFSAAFGRDTRVDEPVFEEFYREEFQNIAKVCGFDPMAAEVIQAVKASGKRLFLPPILSSPPLPPTAGPGGQV